MDEVFRFADDLGPEKIVHIHQPAAGLRAVVVIDNTACGPAIGGVRMAPDVSTEEAFRLARAMTLKNAAAGLAHGGAKSVVFGDPRAPLAEYERTVRAFARAMADLVEYVPGPDMGTDERSMAWVKDEIGRASGTPRELGGIPLDEIGATGIGLAAAVESARPFVDFDLRGARVAVQGFGAVGQNAARALARRGAVLVAASDSRGMIEDPGGIDVEALAAHKRSGASVRDFPRGSRRERDAILDVACEIWIPAARPDVVRADNVGRLRARLVAEGANIPCTPEAEAELHARGVVVLPDFIANAGGVICAAAEIRNVTERAALAMVEEKIRENTRLVLEEAAGARTLPRAAAVAIAERRVRAAMRYRRFG